MLMLAPIGGTDMRGTLLCGVLLITTAGGCYATGDVGVGATYATPAPAPVEAAPGAVAYADTPDMVSVSPGVQVVADYDEPVFFVDDFYWRFNDGFWYRSNVYYGGWYFYERPPVAVLRIDRPYAYAHYRPAGYVARSSVRYRPSEPIVRDHRAIAPAGRGQVYTAPVQSNTVVRDHRGPGAAAPATTTQAPARAQPAAAPAPVVRDHRAPAKESRDHRSH